MKGYVLFSCLLCITGVVPQFFGSQTFSLTKDQRSPTNCLQYFTTPTGTISSFNYGVHTAGPRQISNLDYLACVSTQTTFCSITYTSPGAYLVTGESATPGADYETDAACLTDYIEFRAGSQYIDLTGMGAMVTRFCGSLFPLAGVTSTNDVTATFFDLRIVTNSVEKTTDADLLNVGFSFNYASSVTGSIDADVITGTGTLKSPSGVFVNANPPAASTLTIQRVNNQYSQVRLDFRTLTLEQPNLDGICTPDSITFTGQVYPATFTLCGVNTGQHVYLNFNGFTNIVITIVPSAASAWEIEVTQLRTSDALFAHANCLQYFTTPTGTISSFNYGAETTVADYVIDAACLTDFIEFRPNSQYIGVDGATPGLATRFCGSLFPASGVTSTNGNVAVTFFPLRIVTNFGETIAGDLLNVGFSFNYVSSVPCTITAGK